MRGCLPFLVLFSLSAFAAGDSDRAPVIVELFTSEGCSSCPPADRVLEQLDSRAIVLSEHVDYWDRLGWRDPNSSAAFTQRQELYGRQFHLDGVYTPQMVVDGSVQFNGSEGQHAAAVIAEAARHPRAKVKLSRTGSGLQITIEDSPRAAGVFLALVDPEGASQVSAGENKGRRLHHVAIVRSIRKIATVRRGGGLLKTLELPDGSAARRVIVFLQQESGPICGAALLGPM